MACGFPFFFTRHMPAFAVASGPFLHGFRYSPLGLPSQNLRCLGEAMAGVLPEGMYIWDANNERWSPLGGWPRHLWWLRFLLAVRDATRGTRWEAVGDLAYIERAYAWLCHRALLETKGSQRHINPPRKFPPTDIIPGTI